MRRGRKWLTCFMAAFMALPSAPTPVAQAGGPFKFLHRVKPPSNKNVCVEDLAEEIDWLEHHIASYGTVVAKQPDVWGQARLTKHRHEFEKQMAGQLNAFKESIQGSLARSDQAYLAQAIALSAAVSGPQAVATLPSTSQASTQSTSTTLSPSSVFSAGNGTVNLKFLRFAQPSSPPSAPASPSDGTPLTVPDVADPTKLVSGADTVIQRNQASLLTASNVGFGTAQTIALEPMLHLDQMATYLNHLNELRRLNEGDDTADSPGYALTLVRIPVSVIPGGHTRKGYGAEITVTAEPMLSEELLPTTFRNLVVNDLVDQLSFPLTKVLDDKEMQQLLDDFVDWEYCYELRQSLKPPLAPLLFEEFEDCKRCGRDARCCCNLPGVSCHTEDDDNATESQRAATQPYAAIQPAWHKDNKNVHAQSPMSPKPPMKMMYEVQSRLNTLAIPMSPSRRPQLPFPPSQLSDVYGNDLIMQIAATIRQGLKGDVLNASRVQFMDVQSILSQEINSAHDFLKALENQQAWTVCTPELAQAVRAQDSRAIDELRANFLKLIGYWEAADPALKCKGYKGDCESDFVAWKSDITIALAWAIIVESALLNEQLLEDMRHVAVTKGCHCLSGVEGLQLGVPNPDPVARQAFIDYVRCRWPIHVFALDPVTSDQNIADSFARRRETQFALSLAFTSGNIGARTFTNFARRLEWDYQTIALNRTMVGFSHGDDTFGWRFYPRFQSPDIESNGMVLFRDLIIGGPGRDAELKQRQIEPGMRECVALVIMPAFVPYVRFDTRTNWFRLTHPAKQELTTHQTLKLSRSIKSVQNFSQCVSDGGIYRDGEVERLSRRIHQLDRALPMQTMVADVPFEQTLGGFEMFSTGVRDLAPELIGFYGEPGINKGAETTLFIVGKGFSVHETRVIVGNKAIDPYFPFDDPNLAGDTSAAATAAAAPSQVRPNGAMVLLSRQIMQVTIPAGVQAVKDQVDIHVATPYGISNHLLVPLVKDDTSDSDKGFAWDAPAAVGYVKYDPSNGQAAEFRFEANSPDPLLIDDNTKFPQSLMPKKAYLVAEVNGITAGGQKVALDNTDPIEVEWDKVKKKWKCPLFRPDALEDHVESVLKANLGKSQNIASLAISGYLNFDRQLGVKWNKKDATGLDGAPVYKLTNVMQVTLVTVDPCCERLPAPARPAAPTQPPPADEPSAPSELPAPDESRRGPLEFPAAANARPVRSSRAPRESSPADDAFRGAAPVGRIAPRRDSASGPVPKQSRSAMPPQMTVRAIR